MLFANKAEHISPEMRKGRAIPLYLEILNGLLFPICILVASFELIKHNWSGYDKIKTKSGQNSGENICICSKQYNFEDIRKAYKQYDKATMNNFMMGIISKSISEWYHMNGVEETKDISTIIPVVMKPFSPNINEINIENWTSGITFRFPLKDNLNDAMRETSRNFGFYYQLPHLMSMMIMLRSFAILPNWLSKYLYHFACWNLGMTLSNKPILLLSKYSIYLVVIILYLHKIYFHKNWLIKIIKKFSLRDLKISMLRVEKRPCIFETKKLEIFMDFWLHSADET